MYRTTVLALLACAAVAWGCSRERPDATVNAAVLAQIDKEPTLASATVQSRTEQGHVYLTGRVTSAEQRKRAEDIADDVKGVKGVTNDIQVDVAAPPPTGSAAPPPQSAPAQPPSGSGTPSDMGSGSGTGPGSTGTPTPTPDSNTNPMPNDQGGASQ